MNAYGLYKPCSVVNNILMISVTGKAGKITLVFGKSCLFFFTFLHFSVKSLDTKTTLLQ